MGVLNFCIRVIAITDSWRNNRPQRFLDEFRNRRIYNRAKARYNQNRQSYYEHAPTKNPKDQTYRVSIVVPCYNTPKKYFEPLLDSIFSQGYQNWELIIIDASDNISKQEYIKRRSLADIRIKYLATSNEGIAANTNKGIKKSSGSFIAFLDHDDTLDPDALADSMELFIKNPALELVYSDEDKISDDGSAYFEPHFKPDFSLDMLRNVNYINHFVVAKKTLIEKIGGIRRGFDGAQDYDFLLRVADETRHIGHISKVLYHWRQAEGSTAADFSNKRSVIEAGCKALQDHFVRRGIKHARAQAIKNSPGFYTVRYNLTDKQKRQIVIRVDNLAPAENEYIFDCFRKNKDVQKYDIEVVDAKGADEAALKLEINGPFVPASLKTEIGALFALAEEDGVTQVAPQTLSNGRIFGSGIVKVDGINKYLFRGLDPTRPCGYGSLEWVRNVDEITDDIKIETKHIQNDSRYVIWSHVKFTLLSPSKGTAPTPKTKYYNPNLTDYLEIVETPYDYIVDKIEVKR